MPADRVRASLLDALVDRETKRSGDGRRAPHALESERVQVSLRRDIQDLLNCRQRILPWDPHFTELTNSVFDYGVEDLTGADLSTPERRTQFVGKLAAALRRHDPRFIQVKIEPIESEDKTDRTLRFRFEARVRLERRTERAVYNFELEPVARQFR